MHHLETLRRAGLVTAIAAAFCLYPAFVEAVARLALVVGLMRVAS